MSEQKNDMVIDMKRDFYFDNAKFILICLVVFGHFIQPFIHDHKLISTIYQFVYSFHMPAFILIAGYFAKGIKEDGYIMKITKKLLLPYLIFQSIYSIYYYFLYSGNELYIQPFNPHWSLWFLISLFCWNLLLYVFSKIHPFVAISIAILMGIAIGYFPFVGNFLSISRTFVFLPLFLLGYFAKKKHFIYLKQPATMIVSAICLIIIFAIYYLNPEINTGWLLGSKAYAALDMVQIGGMIRLCFYCVSILSTFSFLSIIPKSKYFFTKWGTRTLYVYLLHGFAIKYFRNSEWLEVVKESADFIFISLASLGLTLLLSSNLIKAISQPLIELRMTFLKKSVYSMFNTK
ncbi:acyltransferase family protein [Ferdinandcohnia quinoae]|uniref:Acyltransferase family protein n=1 Tax=Fredinandcohnia quinoae TaxID=2918902 RepID=A0AAW5EB19_9BACI|nr:acyltransferase family protein [Fredinandcohnia sp. SECRCQ15]MCH1626358.1 acyltransferase family protein [Fredinandcohnia sp. SECRCQ15]